jgi:hypothetical protein
VASEWDPILKKFLSLDHYHASSVTIASYLIQPMTALFKLNIIARDYCSQFDSPKMQKKSDYFIK